VTKNPSSQAVALLSVGSVQLTLVALGSGVHAVRSALNYDILKILSTYTVFRKHIPEHSVPLTKRVSLQATGLLSVLFVQLTEAAPGTAMHSDGFMQCVCSQAHSDG
jgi:hypothetical protein